MLNLLYDYANTKISIDGRKDEILRFENMFKSYEEKPKEYKKLIKVLNDSIQEMEERNAQCDCILAALSDEDRKYLTMNYIDRLTWENIAEKEYVHINTVSRKMRKAKKHFEEKAQELYMS